VTLLYLVRHGETDWNRARRIQGSTDIPLNHTGRAQAAGVGLLLAGRAFNGIASSPLSRAYETAEIIGDAVGIGRIEVLANIVERAYGEAEGLTDHEISQRFPGDAQVPGRESRQDVAARVLPTLVALATRNPGGTLIVATHGGVIRSVLDEIAPQPHQYRNVAIANASVHTFEVAHGALTLLEFNAFLSLDSSILASGDPVDPSCTERRETVERTGRRV